MKAHHLKSILLFLMSSVLLVSCSGGGGPFFASGGIDGSGIIGQGSISGFGSIFVNGTEFDTSNAAIIINGVERGIGDDAVRRNLDIGRVITVEGQRFEDPNTAVADRVTDSNNVKSPVESIFETDALTKEIPVLGLVFVMSFCIGLPAASADDECNLYGCEDDCEFTDYFRLEDCKCKNTGANPYFILKPGYQLVLESDEKKSVETVLCDTKIITLENGRRIKTRVLEERAYEEDTLVEVSLNWFAICKKTNAVYYFGETGGRLITIKKDGGPSAADRKYSHRNHHAKGS